MLPAKPLSCAFLWPSRITSRASPPRPRSLLRNTALRHVRGDIYTFTGDIVTSTNPCRRIPKLYSVETMASIRNGDTARLAPHIFVVCERAYRSMRALKRRQALVISGVSGAGKTEAAKYSLHYLCWRSREEEIASASEPRPPGSKAHCTLGLQA